MANVIVLAAADAAQIQGADSPRTALQPRPLLDGRFYIGIQVLADVAHAAKLPTLSKGSVVDYATLASLVPPVVGPPKAKVAAAVGSNP